jgi:putative glycosyltransferase (TIGR04372 family)
MLIFKNVVYSKFLFLLKILIIVSVNNFFYRNKELYAKNICVPDLNTYGDSILFYDYIRLLNLKKGNYFIIIPKVKQQISLVRIFFDEKQYKIFDEIIYNSILSFFTFFYKILNKRTGSLIIDFNYFLNQAIRKKIIKIFGDKNLITLFRNYDSKNDYYIKKYKKDFSQGFITKYIKTRYLDNKNEFSFEHINLINKKGNFDLKKKLDIDSLKKDIFKKLNISQKYICLFLRPYNSNEQTVYETDVRSSRNMENYIKLYHSYLKKKYQVILMGSYNRIFDNKKYLYFTNYRNSSYQSVLNDFILTSYCEFAICNIGGYAVLPSVLGKPNLLVNTSCFFDNYFFHKTIYHPKSFQKNKMNLSILDIMSNPIFFESSTEAFHQEKIVSNDISYLELYNSVKYFIKIVKNNQFNCKHLSHKIIEKNLTPLHLLFNLSYKRLSKTYLDHQKIRNK